MAIDLELYAQDVLAGAMYGQDTIGDSDFFDELQDRLMTCEEAQNACIYVGDCEDILSRYGTEYDSAYEDSGRTFQAHEWQDALRDYATGIARAVLDDMAHEALEELRAAYATLRAVLPDDLEARISTDCAYGWAPQDEITADDVHVWHKLDGSTEARAVQCGRFWISAAWDSESAE
jgi:hypothetical protein